jgi:hypothetical protein
MRRGTGSWTGAVAALTALCAAPAPANGLDAAQDRARSEMVEALNAYAVAKTGRHAEAYALWAALAEKGNPSGILNAADMLMAGRGVARDPAAAAAWWAKGAAMGDGASLHSLSRAHREGVGAPLDAAEADRLLALAAEAGAAGAQRERGERLLEAGDAEAARSWLRRAADGGDPAARDRLAALGEGPAPAGALPEDDRRRLAAFLRDLDDAANARDADALTAAIAPDAAVFVTPPGEDAPRRMTREEYAGLWRATFAQADRYRFARAWFDVVATEGGARIDSRIRETLGGGGAPPRTLAGTETLEVAFGPAGPVIRAVSLSVDDAAD